MNTLYTTSTFTSLVILKFYAFPSFRRFAKKTKGCFLNKIYKKNNRHFFHSKGKEKNIICHGKKGSVDAKFFVHNNTSNISYTCRFHYEFYMQTWTILPQKVPKYTDCIAILSDIWP